MRSPRHNFPPPLLEPLVPRPRSKELMSARVSSSTPTMSTHGCSNLIRNIELMKGKLKSQLSNSSASPQPPSVSAFGNFRAKPPNALPNRRVERRMRYLNDWCSSRRSARRMMSSISRWNRSGGGEDGMPTWEDGTGLTYLGSGWSWRGLQQLQEVAQDPA